MANTIITSVDSDDLQNITFSNNNYASSITDKINVGITNNDGSYGTSFTNILNDYFRKATLVTSKIETEANKQAKKYATFTEDVTPSEVIYGWTNAVDSWTKEGIDSCGDSYETTFTKNYQFLVIYFSGTLKSSREYYRWSDAPRPFSRSRYIGLLEGWVDTKNNLSFDGKLLFDEISTNWGHSLKFEKTFTAGTEIDYWLYKTIDGVTYRGKPKFKNDWRASNFASSQRSRNRDYPVATYEQQRPMPELSCTYTYYYG